MIHHAVAPTLPRVFTLFVVVLYSLTGTLAAAPLPQSELDALYRDSVHYKVPGTSNTVTCNNDGDLVGSGNAAKAYNYLVGEDVGLKPFQAQGIVGNLMGESSVMPNRKQGAGMQTIDSIKPIQTDIANGDVPSLGFGIAQWTSPGRQQAWLDFAKKQGEDALSLSLQLKYLVHELETDPHYGYAELKKTSDLKNATWIFLAFFERPGTVVDAGLAENPNPPTSGEAYDTLFARIQLAEKIDTSGASGGSEDVTSFCAGADLVDNTNTPDFKKNPRVAIDEAGDKGEDICGGEFTPGAKSLRSLVLRNWQPPVTSVGGYACRTMVGGSDWSIHSVGRALDIMISAENPKTREVGDKIRNYMINNSTALQVQRVIWNCHIWSADQDGWRPYCTEAGRDPHTNHLHVEINIKGAKNANLAGSL